MFDTSAEADYTWLYIYLGFTILFQALNIWGVIDQYLICNNQEQRKRDYDNMGELLKELYPWSKVEESLVYNKDLFRFLTCRHLLAHISFDFLIFFYFAPAYLWNHFLGKFHDWGWCEDGNGGWDMQLLCGLFCAVTFKAAEIAWYTPWAVYQMWCVEKKHGLAEPEVLTFIWGRIAEIISHMIMVVPVVLLIVKVMEWSGQWVFLVFFGSTALVKSIMMWLYPILIVPLFSQYEPMPDYVKGLMPYLE